MKIQFHSEFGEKVENKEHKKWKDEHQVLLKWAKENNSCPSCGATLVKDDILFDRGFKCGIDCEYCN